jgi:hypothetical protein
MEDFSLFNFSDWLSDMGIPYGNQHRFIAEITSTQESIVRSWGSRLESMPDIYKGFLLGYFHSGFSHTHQAPYAPHAPRAPRATYAPRATHHRSYYGGQPSSTLQALLTRY